MASSERRLGEAFPPTKKYWKWPKRIRQRRWRSLRSRLMHRWKTIRKVLALLSSAPGSCGVGIPDQLLGVQSYSAFRKIRVAQRTRWNERPREK